MTVSERAEVTIAEVEAAATRVGSHVRRTPIFRKEALDRQVGVPVHLKSEHLQRTGSFKIRGALNLLSQLGDEERLRGVVAASAGNHAQGVAVAARESGVSARIFMPVDATLSKVEATRGYGAMVELMGASLDEALAAARTYAADTGALFVHPFDDPRIVAGQGTCGLEIVADVPDAATIVVPVGGGGLISGIALAIKARNPTVRVVGVESEAAASAAASLQAGEPRDVEVSATIADGIAVKRPGRLTFALMQRYVDEIVTVSDDQIADAMLWMIERGKQVVEGAGAAGLAAVREGIVSGSTGPIVCVLSGGNIDPVQLMPIVRHGLTAAGRFTSVWTMVPDRPGELSKLLALLAELRVNILAIEHHREGVNMPVGDTRIDLTLQTRNREHVDMVLSRLASAGYDVHVG